MSKWTRSWTMAAATVVALAAVPTGPGVASADVCVSGGRILPTQLGLTFRRRPTTLPCLTTRRHLPTSPAASATTGDG
jgi:hypothetical protein